MSDLTRLDRLGIPVVAAVRADVLGESNTVCTGKGRTRRAARLGALGEAVERRCAEPRDLARTWRAPAPPHAGAWVDSGTLAPAWDLPDDRPRAWILGTAFPSGAPVAVPAAAVWFPVPGAPEELAFAPSTTGLAAGRTREEALVAALLECIERDTVSRVLFQVAEGRAPDCPAVDPAHLGPTVRRWAARIRRAGVDLLFRDLTAQNGVPTLQCTLSEPFPGGDWTWAHAGWAARPDPALAAEAALAEAAQSRLVDIQGAREDLASAHADPDPFFLDPTLRPGPPRARAIAGDAADLVARLRADGAGEPVVVDLTAPGCPLHVLRVVWPGTEHWAFDPARRGPRLGTWSPGP